MRTGAIVPNGKAVSFPTCGVNTTPSFVVTGRPGAGRGWGIKQAAVKR